MKGLAAFLILLSLAGAFILGTKIGAVQQAARGYPAYRVIHEYRAKCINATPTKPKKTSL